MYYIFKQNAILITAQYHDIFYEEMGSYWKYFCIISEIIIAHPLVLLKKLDLHWDKKMNSEHNGTGNIIRNKIDVWNVDKVILYRKIQYHSI